MPNYDLLSFASADELASAAAGAWLDEVEAAKRANKPHTVALSGGRITQNFCGAAVAQARQRNVSFEHVHFFWADERCVPPTDPESNFKMADELLFRPLKIVDNKIHRLRGEDEPETAAKMAATELFRVVGKNQNQNRQPVLDLIFLGMGEDGHTASLFPGDVAKNLDISVPFLVVKNSPKPPPTRITLSYKTIFAAKNIWILISGSGKAQAFRESLSPAGKTPMARVIQARPVKIFSDIAN